MSTYQNALNTLVVNAEKKHLLDKLAFETLIKETSPDVVYDILTSYKTTLKESIDQLNQVQKLTQDDVYKVCHKLKGSSLLIGFSPLGQLCVKAMTGLRESKVDNVEGRVQEVLTCAKDTQAIVLETIV